MFSYQSECHCAKTTQLSHCAYNRLVTSQNVTAPKLFTECVVLVFCLVTSQNVTAPKLALAILSQLLSLVTSQNVTAPKPL